jgi:hypothetical protein
MNASDFSHGRFYRLKEGCSVNPFELQRSDIPLDKFEEITCAEYLVSDFRKTICAGLGADEVKALGRLRDQKFPVEPSEV